jgi:beta-xylosidase
MGNIVVKTKNPFEGWSDPIKLNFDGIDPDLFFDDDGRAYIVHNDAPPRGKALYEGHRVIKQWEYDVLADQVVPGSDHILVDGGVDITQQPVWIEAPHIYKKGGRYYLMCAEGGTGDWHSEVIFMADKATGPFVPAAGNPILSQRYLNPTRANKVDWAGHADIVSTPKGEYYGVFLAVRPNDQNRVNTGRETFILPVDWSGTYPTFVNGLIPLQPKLKMPSGAQNLTGREGFLPAGNFRYDESFAGPALDYRWIGLRGPREDFVSIRKGGGLQMKPFDTNMKAKAPISALFWRQQHRDFSFTTLLEYTPKSATDLAGIAAVQSERFHYVMGITLKGKQPYIVLERTGRGRSEVVASAPIELKKKQAVALRVSARGDSYSFSYATDGVTFTELGGRVSGDILSTDVAGGFTGCMVGLYATTGNDIIPNN